MPPEPSLFPFVFYLFLKRKKLREKNHNSRAKILVGEGTAVSEAGSFFLGVEEEEAAVVGGVLHSDPHQVLEMLAPEERRG